MSSNKSDSLNQELDIVTKDRPLGLQLKAINNLVRRNLDSMFAELGDIELTGIQGPVIDFIYEHSKEENVFQKDIEKAFNIRRSTATVLLQTLENKGYIVREAAEQDARLKKIVLTSKAVESTLAIRDLFERFNARLEANISEDEKDIFCQVLNKIKYNLE